MPIKRSQRMPTPGDGDRVSNHRYTHVPNDVLEDTRLSFNARGILAFYLSKPDHRQFNPAHLMESGPDGRESVRSGQDELEKFGYLSRGQYRDEKGHWTTVITVRDVPNSPVTKGMVTG